MGSPAHVPQSIQEGGHHGDRELEVCPACEGAKQREREGEKEEDFQIWCGGMVGVGDDPVGK